MKTKFGVEDKTQVKIIGAFMVAFSFFSLITLLDPSLNSIYAWLVLIYGGLLIVGGVSVIKLKDWGRKLAIGLDVTIIIYFVIIGVRAIKIAGIQNIAELIISLIIPVLIYDFLTDKRTKKLFN